MCSIFLGLGLNQISTSLSSSSSSSSSSSLISESSTTSKMQLQRLSTRILTSTTTILNNHCHRSFHSKFTLQTRLQSPNCRESEKQLIPTDFLKWGSLGFHRNAKFATGFSPLQLKPLDSIIDVERVKDRSAEEIASIWDDLKAKEGKKVVSLDKFAAADRLVYLRQMLDQLTFFERVQMPHMSFTGLEDYKARGTQAAPYFTVTHYTEFAESKDLVLIRGDVVFTSKLSDTEAQWLLETAQSFYLNDMRYKLVERFNKETRDFEFNHVLQALEMPIG
ncbi:hypothetical protein Syun_008625 [Stephania yunnanensis]|uniref:ATP synthase mitochondrial F1 complex assembly factor 1 n=1 Tax=Stephania yunnanensis TaxID=152371 RepID=A0AAP0KCX8_9MAGN